MKPFGWTGVPVPVIGQGTWMIEGSRAVERRSVDALRLGLDLGMTHIDTAEMYGSGRAEELVAEAIAGRINVEEFFARLVPFARDLNAEEGSPNAAGQACRSAHRGLAAPPVGTRARPSGGSTVRPTAFPLNVSQLCAKFAAPRAAWRDMRRRHAT
jgi:hypothetical protein